MTASGTTCHRHIQIEAGLVGDFFSAEPICVQMHQKKRNGPGTLLPVTIVAENWHVI